MPAPTADTLIDRVDDSDTSIGLVKRGDVFKELAGFRTVHVFVRNATGSILLQHIGNKNKRSAGRWGSSVAGYLHAGESYLAAARRRMREEIGITEPLTKLGAVRMLDEGATKFVELYGCRAETAEIRDEQSISQLRFWSEPEIRRGLKEEPDVFTTTFAILFELYEAVAHQAD